MSGNGGKQCKVFVGGLHLDTTNECLQGYFEQYGTIVDAIVMRDGSTKKSRGFGFVTFDDPESVEKCACAGSRHLLDGKEVEVKRAVPKEDTAVKPFGDFREKTKKVFLGGLSPETTKADIEEVLEVFGKLFDVLIVTEKTTEKPRGFGFAIFEDYDSVDRLCSKKYHRIRDRDVEVKKAISQEDMRRVEARGAPRASGGNDGWRSQDPYARSGGGGGGGYYNKMGYPGDYRMGGYDYSRYASEYMRAADSWGAGGYSMGYGDRAASAGYQAYGGAAAGYRYPQQYDYSTMYPQQSSMGTYQQTASSYGPSRGAFGDKDKDRGVSRAAYHPYRR